MLVNIIAVDANQMANCSVVLVTNINSFSSSNSYHTDYQISAQVQERRH